MGRNYKVQVGHFKDQGEHYSGMSYPELMEFHHRGTGVGPGEVPARPVLTFVGESVDNTTFRPMQDVFRSRYTLKAILEALTDIGENIKDIEQDIIGSSPPLKANAPRTLIIRYQEGRGTENSPLEDTGDLKDNVEVRIKK